MAVKKTAVIAKDITRDVVREHLERFIRWQTKIPYIACVDSDPLSK